MKLHLGYRKRKFSYMLRKLLIALANVALLVSLCPPSSASVEIDYVYDGDTLTLTTGQRVRLLQIDTPELSPKECYGLEAKAALIELLDGPGDISLKSDPNLDDKDRYGRLLRYLFKGKTNINLKLVEIGAAAPYFYKSEKGTYADEILKAAKKAKASNKGFWKRCPNTILTPTRALTTTAIEKTIKTSAESSSLCDPNYKECLPVFPPDINCVDIRESGLSSIHVIGKDVHKLDRDGDGVGCD